MKLQGLKVGAYAAFGGAVLFAAIGGVSSGYSTKSVVLLAICGFFVGAIAAPEFEPSYFRYPSFWQAASGGVAGAVFALLLSASPEAVPAGVLVGLILGYLAPYWIRHVKGP